MSLAKTNSSQSVQPAIVPATPVHTGRAFNKTFRKTFKHSALMHLSADDQLLFEVYGQGPIETPQHHAIHHAFEEQALSQPDAIAAEAAGETITYGELNRQAQVLAAYLAGQGIGKGDNICLFVERSIGMLIGIFATLKVGAAYVPQDARIAPEEQLAHIINTTGSHIALTLSHLQSRIPVVEGVECVSIDSFLETHDCKEHQLNAFIPRTSAESNDNCFILFTSGTTGKPNGVQVTHGNLCNILLTSPGNLGIKPGSKVAQQLNIAFDMAAWEILGCLSQGGTLMIRGKDFSANAGQCDVLIATPSILSTIDADRCQNVHTVAVAGEPCPRPLADLWASFCRFYNSCGPTETTIINTAQHYRPDSELLTIGAPTPNNTVYVLNENMEACAMGEIGEMWAGGDCVTAGYLNNPTLSSDRYRPDPFLGQGRMMFRTRDLGRWTTEGELEHFGRTDDQVKVKGFRVELDSVSTALEKTEKCTQAVTLKLDSSNLVAFVCPADVDIEKAREQLTLNLPYYCHPTHILPMDNFPKTSRGKIDKRELLKAAAIHHIHS